MLFVSSGFLETEGFLLTLPIERAAKTLGGNQPATTPTEITVVAMTSHRRPH
jgi:hypothetical protein